MDRQTLRDWVHRYNADGLAGLADGPGLGVSLVWPKPAERSGDGWKTALTSDRWRGALALC